MTTSEWYNEQIAKLEKILEQDAQNFDALKNLGVIYAQVGKLEDAITKLEIAVKIKSDNASLWNTLGEAYRRSKNFHKANVCRMRAIQLNEASSA